MYNLTEVKNFYRSLLGRLFIIIVALVIILASSLVAVHYHNKMTQIDDKIKANSEFVMTHSVNQLEAHLAIFQLAEKQYHELNTHFQNSQTNANVLLETFANFPSYVNTRLFILDGQDTLSPLTSLKNNNDNNSYTIADLGFKQSLTTQSLLIGIPRATKQDNTLRLPLAYLTTASTAQQPLLMVAEIDLNSQYNPWHYELLESSLETLITQKSAINNQYWRIYHSSPSSLQDELTDPYSQAMPIEFVSYVNSAIKQITGRPITHYRQSDGVSIYTNRTKGIPRVRVGVSYNEKFNTFVGIRIRLSTIYDEISHFAAWVSLISLIAIAVSFLITLHLYRLDLAYKDKLYRQANFDPLTQLANRYFFDNTLAKQHSRQLSNYALLCVDLDNFKHINDHFGRHTGDKVLALVANRITQCCPQNALPVRTGADEFFIMVQSNEQHVIASLAAELLHTISESMELDNLNLSITASIGIYSADQGVVQQTAEVHAEIAMFEAKKLRNRYCFFDEGLADQLHYRVNVETALKHAVKNQEFYLTYQPQVCSTRGHVRAVEVLLRWQNDQLGVVPPDKFIPIAEETGLIAEIGEYVIQQAFNDYSQFIEQSNIGLSINVSAYQLMYTPLLEVLTAYAEQYRIQPSHVTLEVTESLFIEDKVVVQELFEQLIDFGFLISLDDFGTGYSSLSQLRDAPIHELKIDRSFITHIHEKDKDAALLHQIVSIAKCHNIMTVAEGIELLEQHDIAQTLGIDLEQGYLHAKPMRIRELIQYLYNDSSLKVS